MDDPLNGPTAKRLSLWRLAVKMLPILLAVGAILMLAEEFLFEDEGVGTGAHVAAVVMLMTYAIHFCLGGEAGTMHQRLTLRGMGATAMPLLLGVGIAVAVALQAGRDRMFLFVMGCALFSLPLAFAILGPWVLRQVAPGHRAAPGGLWGRLWRMTLIGAVPVLLAMLVLVLALGGDAPVVAGRWPTALAFVLISTIGNFSFVVYAWALSRTAEPVSSP